MAVAVTTPLPANDGDLLKTLSAGGRTLHVVCFIQFTGSPVTPDDPQQWNPELFVTLGRTLGRMQRVTATFQPRAGVRRYPWYEETEFRHLGDYRGVVPDRCLTASRAISLGCVPCRGNLGNMVSFATTSMPTIFSMPR